MLLLIFITCLFQNSIQTLNNRILSTINEDTVPVIHDSNFQKGLYTKIKPVSVKTKLSNSITPKVRQAIKNGTFSSKELRNWANSFVLNHEKDLRIFVASQCGYDITNEFEKGTLKSLKKSHSCPPGFESYDFDEKSNNVMGEGIVNYLPGFFPFTLIIDDGPT